MEKLWIIHIELCVEPGDFASGDTIGFMNVVTWASLEEEAVQKLTTYLQTFKWHVLGVEDATPVDDDWIYPEEMGDMIDRARGNDKAILLGTFHSYKTN